MTMVSYAHHRRSKYEVNSLELLQKECREKEFIRTPNSNNSPTSSNEGRTPPPWIAPASRRKRKSPLEFELEACGRKMTVVYDSMLNKNIGSVPLLKTFNVKKDRVTLAQFVRIPSNQNRFEICYEKMKLPIRIEDKLLINCSFYCTTFPERKLFFGRSFGENYIKNINLRTNLMTLSDGKTEACVKFNRLKYKKKSTMN